MPTTIQVDEETRDTLWELKRSSTESYDDVVRRLLDEQQDVAPAPN